MSKDDLKRAVDQFYGEMYYEIASVDINENAIEILRSKLKEARTTVYETYQISDKE